MFFDFSKYIFYVLPGGTDMRKGADSLAQSVYNDRKNDFTLTLKQNGI